MKLTAKYLLGEATRPSEITRLKNFNQESDVFIMVMDLLEKDKSSAERIINLMASAFTGDGLTKSIRDEVKAEFIKFLKNLSQHEKDEFMKEIKKIIFNPWLTFENEEFINKVALISTFGLYNELNENPEVYRDFLSDTHNKEMEDRKVQRGKEKFASMMGSRGRN